MALQSPRAAHRLARGSIACQRCRRRKQKCDLKYPTCSNCEGVQAQCLVYDSGKQADVPRDYVLRLEAQVDSLNAEVRRLQALTLSDRTESETQSLDVQRPIYPSDGTVLTTTTSPSHLQDLAKRVANVPGEFPSQQHFLGPSSGITLAKLVMAMIHVETLPSAPSFDQGGQSSPDPFPLTSDQEIQASLPPKQAADHLINVYFQYRTPHLPIIDRQQVERALTRTYAWMGGQTSLDANMAKDIFATFMVLAIALCDLPNPETPASRGRPPQSLGCFLSALVWVEKVIAHSKSDLEKLRAILFLAQFVALNPSRGSLWHLTGIALRLCIDLGLHWETEEQTLNMDPAMLQERRRLWYCTYYFDRVLCNTLGRPFGIADDSVHVPLPSPWLNARRPGQTATDVDIHHERAFNHLFSMAVLESEILHVQQNQTCDPKLASPRANYNAWILDIQPRLQEWYATIPPSTKAHPSSIFSREAYWDSTYNNTFLLLYRPNPTSIRQSPEALSMTFEASSKLIDNIKALQRDGKCESLWKTIHHLFMAGMGVMYGLWQSKEIRDRNSLSTSIASLQACASTLSAMSETFPPASGCRDVFEALSSATIDFLIKNDAEQARQHRIDFDKQATELLGGLQSSYGGANTSLGSNTFDMDSSAMPPLDSFAFGELLSSAAQWPAETEECDLDMF